jgi:acyl carrier protein
MARPTEEEITTWCREYLADLLNVPVASIDPDTDFDRLGVDSALAVSLLVEVESRYGVEAPPEALFENPTISALASYLRAQVPGAQVPGDQIPGEPRPADVA